MPQGRLSKSNCSSNESLTRSNLPHERSLLKTVASTSPIPPGSATSSRSSTWANFLRYWLPVVLWMSLIFGMSTNAGSTQNTSRIIGPILRWFNPSVADETIWRIQLVVRKTAHFTEYGILSLLLWRARRRPVGTDVQPWKWSEVGFALGLTVLFAITDEWHQSFVPSREGSLRDVLIDSAGALTALVCLWLLGRRLRKW